MNSRCKRLVAAVVLPLLLVITSGSAVSQVKLCKLKVVEPSNDSTVASNLVWDENGVQTSMFEKAGDRTIILTFWGSWCVYCYRHLPELQKAFDYLPKDSYYFLNVARENNDNTEQIIISILQDNGVTHDNVWYSIKDKPEVQADAFYNIDKYTSTVIISPDRKKRSIIYSVIYNSLLDSLKSSNLLGCEDDLSGGRPLSPNPVSGMLSIGLATEDQGIAEVRIYNSVGVVEASFSREITAGEKSPINYDCSGLQSGVYFYSIALNGKNYRGRFLIVR